MEINPSTDFPEVGDDLLIGKGVGEREELRIAFPNHPLETTFQKGPSTNSDHSSRGKFSTLHGSVIVPNFNTPGKDNIRNKPNRVIQKRIVGTSFARIRALCWAGMIRGMPPARVLLHLTFKSDVSITLYEATDCINRT